MFIRLSGLGAASIAGCISGGQNLQRETGETTPDTDRSDGVDERFAGTTTCDEPGQVNRFLCRGQLLEDFEGGSSFEDLEEWTIWGGDVSITDLTAGDGNQSLTMTASVDQERCGVIRRFDVGIDLSEYDLSIAAKLELPENHGIFVQYLAPDRENLLQSKRYCWSAGWLRLDHGPTEIRGKPDLTDVREIRIGMFVGNDAKGQLDIDSIRVTKRRERGAVVFTFDDGHISQYEKAFPAMQEYGYPGTLAIIPWNVTDEDRTGVDTLEEMHDAGWEIVSHPQLPDKPLPELSRPELERTLAKSNAWLAEHGFGSGARFVVWPFGQYDEDVLDVAAEHHELGFSTATSVVGTVTDPLIIPRVNAGNLENSKRMIDFAEQYNQVCVLMYHQISDVDRSIQATESQLKEVLEHVANADVDVLSVPEYYDEIFQA